MAQAPSGPPPLIVRLMMRSVTVVGVALITIIVMSVVTTVWWRFSPTKELDVFVYDQTVANDSYPDHAVLEQLLEYHRVPYDAEDYVGAAPGGGSYGTWPTERPDLIFLADLYGLYVNEEGFLDDNGRFRITDRLNEEQSQDIVDWIDAGTPAYAEFGLVSEPTAREAGPLLQEAFGFTDTGWAVKPYDDLRNVSPQIQSLGPSPWPYDGPGWILVEIPTPGSSADPQLFVLPESMLESPYPLVIGGPPGTGGGEAPFRGWLGVIEPRSGVRVDAWVDFDLRPEGEAIFAEAGVPLRVPGLIRTDRTLYFAGDGLDDETPFRLNRLKGGALVTRLVTGKEFRFLYQVLEPSVNWMIAQSEIIEETSG